MRTPLFQRNQGDGTICVADCNCAHSALTIGERATRRTPVTRRPVTCGEIAARLIGSVVWLVG